MKKSHVFILISLVVLITTAGVMIFYDRAQAPIQPEESTSPQTTDQPENNSKQEISLIINSGEGASQTIKLEFKQGLTVFEVLKQGADELNLPLKTKTYDLGILIEAIGDHTNGTDNKYWLFYVNGQMPMKAADQQLVQPGDKVEFKFEASPF